MANERTVEEHPWREIHPDLAVTMSIGLGDATTLPSAIEMFRVTDEKLFEAKRQGRNRVCG